MKKRVFSALLVLCMACSLVSTVWASPSTPETATPETAAPASPTPSPTPDVSAYPARTLNETVEGSGVTVQVDIPAGSLPADARLTAELLGASTDADAADTVADVAAELDEADVDYDGFVALDISFVDAAGAKIEPLQPVSVSFSLPADLLPAEADPATLAVQHLAEDETGEVETVETVADVADETAGTVTVEAGAAALSLEEDAAALPADAEVKAEFEVDGFSTFTVTFNWKPMVGDTKTATIQFVIKDTDGNDIITSQNYTYTEYTDEIWATASQKEVARRNVEDLIRQQNMWEIDGHTDGGATQSYTFQTAVYVNGDERHPINQIGFGRYSDGSHTLEIGMRLYDAVFNAPESERGYYSVFDTNATLELVYHRTEDSTTTINEPEPLYTKQVTKLPNGNYDLSLSVTGAVGNVIEAQKIDVLFVVDQSGSMEEWNFQETVASCASALAESLGTNTNLDARFAVVTFGDGLSNNDYYDDAKQQLLWTSDYSKVYEAANQRSGGGTNYEAGLMAGRAAMIEARPDALKYVIFLSDGVPTYHYNNSGGSTGGGDHTTEADINEALAEADNYTNVNGFFTVRVGYEADADTYLEQLSNRVQAATGITNDDTFQDYTAENADQLTQKFQNIESQITSINVKNVTISDTLSSYVEGVTGKEPYYVIYDKEGNKDESISLPAPSCNGKSLSWALGNTYELIDGYTYELHLEIQPTNTAYQEYATNGYNVNGHLGDKSTGDYAGKIGFYTNDSATLSYDTDMSDSNSSLYPMPVIQVPSTSLTISKTMKDLPVDQWDTAADQITFTVKDDATAVATINLGTAPPADANYTIQKTDTGYTVVVNGLTVTKDYTVTETCEKLNGYNVASTLAANGQNITMSKDAAQNKLDVTNTYTPDNQTLTITKTVGGEMGSYTDDFTFTLTLEKTGSPAYTTPLAIEEGTTAKDASGNQYTGTLTTTDGTYTFVLSNDEQMVLSVPYGYAVTITEQQENNGYTVSSRSYATGSQKPGLTPGAATQTIQAINEDSTVEFANNRNPVAPTGLESNHTTPYVLMITAAGMAGLALIGGIVARRIRRRRQE